jgi:poly-gamma-glutamate synthesis protein (capsule biosynthesis protein)
VTPVTIAAVGDVFVDRPEPAEALSGIAPLLESSDVTFANFEGVLTDRHAPVPGASDATIVPASHAAPLHVFDVLSLANNHSLDAGHGGLADTIEALAGGGAAVVGAGPTLAAASRPAVVERGGTRVAFVAATSVFPMGAEAHAEVPGVAPLRVEDYYSAPVPGMHTPGVPPQVVSVVDEDDWNRLAAAVDEARGGADLVVASVHWGDHTRPWVLTDNERTCAQLLVEAGADVVLGHHHHLPRGFELFGGKPVFYGLGHAVFDQPRLAEEFRRRGLDLEATDDDERAAVFGEWAVYPRRESPSFPFHPLYRRSMAAVVELHGAELVRAGVAPLLVDEDGIARPVTRRDPGWPEALGFLAECLTRGDLATEVRDAGWVHGGCDLVELGATA